MKRTQSLSSCTEDLNSDISHPCLLLTPKTEFVEEDEKLNETENTHRQISIITPIDNSRKKNKILRLHGLEYYSLQKAHGTVIQTIKSQRQLKAVPCNHGTAGFSDRSFVCGSVSDQARKDIFDHFWSLSSWEAKKAYVLNSIAARDVVKRRKANENDRFKRKAAGFDCCLPREDGVKVRVCRNLFLATLDITKDTFTDWTKNRGCTNDRKEIVSTTSDKASETNKRPLKSESVEQWLDLLVPRHNCCWSSSRTYVDDALHSKKQMHEIYVSWCKSKSLEFVQRKKFCEILESKKISIYKPRKDQCDTCVSYKEGNLDELDYQRHLSRVEESLEAKKRAIDSSSDEHLVCIMDLCVQLCPKLLVPSQYYNQKLELYVFTIYINNTNDVFLFVWHESDGSFTCNELVTCIVTFIQLYAAKGYKEISLISDSRDYRNGNEVLSSALADISRLKSVVIQQIILEKGHNMMEIDSVYATLEKCFIPPLYTPADYITNMRKARPSQPYIISHVDYKFFKNFEAVPSNFTSIRPVKEEGDSKVDDITSLLHSNGETFYKIRLDETEWLQLPQKRRADLYEDAGCLYSAPREIEKSKFDSLQSLKPFMHRDYHFFYDNLFS